MALDFHRLDNNDYLFKLEDAELMHLSGIFETFSHYTGLVIDPYADMILTIANQETLIKIIDKYIDTANLHEDRQKTAAIAAFRGILHFFVSHKIGWKLKGD
jgi:putative SOS response-associated peptidase YedK